MYQIIIDVLIIYMASMAPDVNCSWKSACHVCVLEIVDSGRKVLGEVYVGSTPHPLIVGKQSIHCYERANTTLHFPLLQERVFTQSVCF